MTSDYDDDEFNDLNIIMNENKNTDIPPYLTCKNETQHHIHNKDWDRVVERVKERAQVTITCNNSNLKPPTNLPLEIECPTMDGDTPLFTCLRNEKVPHDVIKTMIGKCALVSMKITILINFFLIRLFSRTQLSIYLPSF